MSETEVIEQPKTEKLPAGKTVVGEKFRTEFAKLQSTVKTDPEPVKEEEKVEEKPAVKPSPLDVASGTAKTEKKEEGVEWEKEEVLKEFDPQKANWQKARQTMGTQAVSIRKLQKDIEEAKKSGASTEYVTTLTQELTGVKTSLAEKEAKLAERDEAIKAINAEYSEEYKGLKSAHDKVVDKATRQLEAVAGKERADSLREALALPQGKIRNNVIKEVIAELEPEDKTRVLTKIELVDESEDKITDFKSNLPGKFDELQKKRDAAASEKAEQETKALETNYEKVARTLSELHPTLREVPEDVEGAEDWNSGVRKAVAEGLRVLKPGATFEESVATAAKGQRYDALEKMLLDTRKELITANGRLAEFDRGGSDFKGGKKVIKEVLTPAEKYHKAMAASQNTGSE